MAYDRYKLKRYCICIVLPYINLFGMIDYDRKLKGYFVKEVTRRILLLDILLIKKKCPFRRRIVLMH